MTALERPQPLAGAKVANLSPALAEELGSAADGSGVVIIDDQARLSPAARLGLQAGRHHRCASTAAQVDTRRASARSCSRPTQRRWTLTIRARRQGQTVDGRGDEARSLRQSTGLFEAQAPRPLADRLRPQSLAEVVGQDHLLGPGRADRAHGGGAAARLDDPVGAAGLRQDDDRAAARRAAPSSHFEPLSAVFSGVADLRKVFEAAQQAPRRSGQGTLLFVDEIHRFNRAQQDALLPVCRGRHRRSWSAPRPRTRPSS